MPIFLIAMYNIYIWSPEGPKTPKIFFTILKDTESDIWVSKVPKGPATFLKRQTMAYIKTSHDFKFSMAVLKDTQWHISDCQGFKGPKICVSY